MTISGAITLSTGQEAVVERLLSAGRFASRDAVVEAGLTLLARQEGLPAAEDEEVFASLLASYGPDREAAMRRLRSEVLESLDRAAAGPVHDGPTAMRKLREKYERLANEQPAPR